MRKKRVNLVAGGVLALVVLACLGVFLWQQGIGAGSGEAVGSSGLAANAGAEADVAALRAIVHDGDGGVAELPLSEDRELTVTASLGSNVVVVSGGAVFVAEADCDNQDCVRQGSLSAPGRQIICLPHKLWIEVVADDGEAGAMDPDSVAGGESFDAVAR